MLLQEVRDHLPLQQGLRPKWFVCYVVVCFVRDHLPLQQGLRLPFGKSDPCSARDHLPLQQGLRPCFRVLLLARRTSETIFHYNKD